jgi:hypothetical protein
MVCLPEECRAQARSERVAVGLSSLRAAHVVTPGPLSPRNGDPDEMRAARAAVLDRVQTTYRAYRTTGYSERWPSRARGAALARQEYED